MALVISWLSEQTWEENISSFFSIFVFSEVSALSIEFDGLVYDSTIVIQIRLSSRFA